mmetsp:Transcript_20115/g.27943  ORF Transcript_20115/g.27943 Transcript_20115/m.27943 type:complete len:303 (+) Transcript_20115:597-1505(+)
MIVPGVVHIHAVLLEQRLQALAYLCKHLPHGLLARLPLAPRELSTAARRDELVAAGGIPLRLLPDEVGRRGVRVACGALVMQGEVRADDDPGSAGAIHSGQVPVEPRELVRVEVVEVQAGQVNEAEVYGEVARRVRRHAGVEPRPEEGGLRQQVSEGAGGGRPHSRAAVAPLPERLPPRHVEVALVGVAVVVLVVADDWDPWACAESGLEAIHVRVATTIARVSKVVRVVSHVHDGLDAAIDAVLQQISHSVVARVTHVAVDSNRCGQSLLRGGEATKAERLRPHGAGRPTFHFVLVLRGGR